MTPRGPAVAKRARAELNMKRKRPNARKARRRLDCMALDFNNSMDDMTEQPTKSRAAVVAYLLLLLPACEWSGVRKS